MDARCRSSVTSDTKWLSWLAYQFHLSVSKRRNNPSVDDRMNLELFKSSFRFKIVRPPLAARESGRTMGMSRSIVLA